MSVNCHQNQNPAYEGSLAIRYAISHGASPSMGDRPLVGLGFGLVVTEVGLRVHLSTSLGVHHHHSDGDVSPMAMTPPYHGNIVLSHHAVPII